MRTELGLGTGNLDRETESTSARNRERNWSSWVGEPSPPGARDNRPGARITSVATVVLVWLSAITLAVSGYVTTTAGKSHVPDWQLAGLALLSAVVVGLVVVFSDRRKFIAIGAIFGLVLVIPWALSGLLQVTVQTDGTVTGVVALVVVAIVSGCGVTPPHWLRLSVLFILMAAVWISLAAGVADLLGSGFGALHFANERELLGVAQFRGILGHPNTLALLASFAAVLSFQFARAAVRSGRQLVGFVIGLSGPAVAIALVILTQSKIGVISLLVGLMFVLLPLRGRLGQVWSWALIIGLYVASFGPPILASMTAWTFNGRATAWVVATEIYGSKPVFGAGPDAFVDLPARLTPFWAPGHAHSQVLQASSTAGLVGLALLGIAAGVAAWIAVQARDRDYRWSLGTVGVFATFAMVEPALGVAVVPVTFLPVVAASCVLGSAYALYDSGVRAAPGRRNSSANTR